MEPVDATTETAGPEPSFEEVLSRLEGVEGWLTDGQARRLWEAAAALPSGRQIVEIGSYRGRSAIVLASAAAAGVAVVAIDPHAGNDRGPQQIHGSAEEGDADNRVFVANLAARGSRRARAPRPPGLREALGEVDGDIDLLYIDGAHRYRFVARRHRELGAAGSPAAARC